MKSNYFCIFVFLYFCIFVSCNSQQGVVDVIMDTTQDEVLLDGGTDNNEMVTSIGDIKEEQVKDEPETGEQPETDKSETGEQPVDLQTKNKRIKLTIVSGNYQDAYLNQSFSDDVHLSVNDENGIPIITNVKLNIAVKDSNGVLDNNAIENYGFSSISINGQYTIFPFIIGDMVGTYEIQISVDESEIYEGGSYTSNKVIVYINVLSPVLVSNPASDETVQETNIPQYIRNLTDSKVYTYVGVALEIAGEVKDGQHNSISGVSVIFSQERSTGSFVNDGLSTAEFETVTDSKGIARTHFYPTEVGNHTITLTVRELDISYKWTIIGTNIPIIEEPEIEEIPALTGGFFEDIQETDCRGLTLTPEGENTRVEFSFDVTLTEDVFEFNAISHSIAYLQENRPDSSFYGISSFEPEEGEDVLKAGTSFTVNFSFLIEGVVDEINCIDYIHITAPSE